MKVFHTIQSPGNEPVEYAYTHSAVTPIQVIAAVADLMATDFSDVPESHRPRTLAIRVEF